MAKLRKGYARRKDGSLQYAFTFNGRRHYVYGKSYTECETKYEELKEKLKKRIYIGNDCLTLSQYFKEWNERRIGSVKKTTILTAENRCQRIEKSLGKFKINEIEPRQIHAFKRELEQEGKLTTSGINQRLTLLNSIMKSAVIDRIIIFNPCDGVKQLKRTEVTATETTHRALTEKEQKLFFESAKEHSNYYPFFAFLVATGCRAGEASALQWKDVDRKTGMIHIRRTITRVGANEFATGTPKTKTSLRDIPLTKDIESILAMQKEQMIALYGNDIIQIGARIFQDRNGGFVKPQGMQHVIKNILECVKKETGTEIDYFSLHALRATFATRAIENGMNPQTLKTILGHSSFALTMDLYSHVLPNTKTEEMNRMKAII